MVVLGVGTNVVPRVAVVDINCATAKLVEDIATSPSSREIQTLSDGNKPDAGRHSDLAWPGV